MNASSHPPFAPHHHQPPQPPKQTHTLRTVLLTIGAVFGILILIGALAGGGGTEDAADTPGTAPASQPSKAAPAVKQTAPAPTPSKKATQPAPSKEAPKVNAVDCVDQADRSKPCGINLGKAFQLGSHQVLSGWKVGASGLNLVEIRGKAKNIGEKPSTMFITVKFLRGNEVVMNVGCNTDQLEPGQVQSITCFGGEKLTKKYDRITAEAMF